MEARYLRVKNWGEFQHYRDKEPGWIKLYAKTLRDNRFLELAELEQWQLVRLWIVASQSSRFAHDEEGRKVPVLVDDEQSLRRSVATLRKIPLAKFIRDGWLIPVAADELLDEHTGRSPREALDDGYTSASPLLEVESRDLELAPNRGSSSFVAGPKILPVNDHLIDKLMAVCGSSADAGTEPVLRSYACRLPESSLAKVIETTSSKPLADRARYANGALQSELAERSAAA